MEKNIKRIAESLRLEAWDYDHPAFGPIVMVGKNGYPNKSVRFDPYTNSADAFTVLEACIKIIKDMEINGGVWAMKLLCAMWVEEGVKAGICDLYLSLIGGE